MAGHIVLLSCLLAICIPIVFVQLPRFDIKELHAENEAETRSSVLRRRPLSSPRKVLRRSTRPWSETGINIASVESEQMQNGPEQVTQAAAAGRQGCASAPRSIIQRNAFADDGVSREEDGTKEVSAGKKPWDPPFRRQPPTTEPIKKSLGGRSDAVTHATPPRKTGRGLKASGVAMRLFPPDPVPDMNQVNEYDRCWTSSSEPLQHSQEPLYQRLEQMGQPQARGSIRQASPQRYHLKHSRVRGIPPQCTDTESLPSPLDESPLPSKCHLPRDTLPTGTKKPLCCHYRHCRHALTDASLPQPPRNVAPNEAFQDVLSEISKSAPEKAVEDIDKQARKEASKAVSKTHKPSLVPWRALLVTMGMFVFTFAFAILVAHCLAWFLVYKTEARLGEVRSGLLRGGEMKLCLCGKG